MTKTEKFIDSVVEYGCKMKMMGFKKGLKTMMREVVESNIKTDRTKLCEFFDLMKRKYKF